MDEMMFLWLLGVTSGATIIRLDGEAEQILDRLRNRVDLSGLEVLEHGLGAYGIEALRSGRPGNPATSPAKAVSKIVI
jgi:hypothetical protein